MLKYLGPRFPYNCLSLSTWQNPIPMPLITWLRLLIILPFTEHFLCARHWVKFSTFFISSYQPLYKWEAFRTWWRSGLSAIVGVAGVKFLLLSIIKELVRCIVERTWALCSNPGSTNSGLEQPWTSHLNSLFVCLRHKKPTTIPGTVLDTW